MRKQYNWKPVVRSFFKIAMSHGFTPYKVDNGDGNVATPTLKKAVEEACACDDASVYLKHPDREKPVWFYLVLGNEPEETVSDYGAIPIADKVFEEFCAKWEGKPCPTIMVETWEEKNTRANAFLGPGPSF